MHLTSTPSILLAGLLPAVALVPRKTPLPVLSHGHLEATADGVTISTTNLEVGYQGPLADAQVDEPGAILLPMHRLTDLLGHLPKDVPVTLRSTASQIRLTAPQGYWTMPLMPVEDFPDFPTPASDDPTLFLPAAALVRLLASTLYAASEDSSRPILQALHLESRDGTLHAVCTDGHMLAWSQWHSPDLPEQMCNLLASAGLLVQRWATRLDTQDIALTLGKSCTFWTCGDVTMHARLLDVTYPNWHALMPQGRPETVCLPVGALQEILTRGATQQQGPLEPVQLTLDTNTLIVEALGAQGEQLSREVVPCRYAGPARHMRISTTMMRDILNHLPDQPATILLALSDHSQPIRLTLDNDPTWTVLAIGRNDSRPAAPEER